MLITALLALVAVPAAAGLYIDLRWFRSVGFSEVLSTQLLAQVYLGCGAAAIAGAWIYVNLRFAIRRARGTAPLYLYDPDGLPRVNLGALAERLTLPVSGIVALLSGLAHYPRWDVWLLAQNATHFGKNDAIFGRDIGFYVFVLPLWKLLSGFGLFVLGASILAVGALYAARGALHVSEGETRISMPARRHLSVLMALGMLTLGLRAYLATFDLLYSTVGPMAGASYADVHGTLPLLRVMVASSVVAAVLVLVNGQRSGFKLALTGGGLYLLSALVLFIYPSLMHRFIVQPNELERESEFLKHNIDATRAAFGLDRVQERELVGQTTLSDADIANNADTIDNIRLWDHHPLLDTFAQIQEIRTYYDFASVDNDRYMIGGKLRQTLLSVRELNSSTLPNRTWLNERFAYTHGYGLTLGTVNEATAEGLPVLLVQDIPPVSTIPNDINISQPAIYFGERSNDYVFVRTQTREIDYPAQKDLVYTEYQGRDGVRFDSALVRLALALKLGDLKILLSNDIDSDSRVLLYRDIRSRLARVAPFLVFDTDPYMVVREDGTLAWICDAYTATDRYPYSERSQFGVNYIRNSVKAVVDAYHGTVQLYVADDKDPIIAAWQKIFPQSFLPLAKMPSDLRAHLRYPVLAFDIQTEMLAVYHMAGSELLYNREDQWEVPAISTGDTKEAMRPYYTVMKLPGEDHAEFILMLPFTPKRKDNLAAWMVARSDAEHLGELIVYRFPKDRLVYGPQQVVNRINQDAEISRQISLWDQRGSQAELGTLLVIPIEESLIYVRPLYLRSQGGKIPELKRVIVAHENKIAMAPSLREAMDAIFGARERQGTTANVIDAAPGASAQPSANVNAQPSQPTQAHGAPEQRALQHFDRAIQAQRAGDWASYGSELREVEQLLRNMQPDAVPPMAPPATNALPAP